MAPPGALLYSLVARGPVVLAEHSDVTGNAPMVALSILERLPGLDQKTSYVSDRHVFHILAAEGLVFLVMADEVGAGWRAARRVVTQGCRACSLLAVGQCKCEACRLQCSAVCSAHPRTSLSTPPSPSPQSAGKRIPFAFLQEVRQRFLSLYSAVARQAVAYEMNTEFSRVLAERMEFYNTHPEVRAKQGDRRLASQTGGRIVCRMCRPACS